MGGFASILGQPRAVEILHAAVASGKVHHAYLFEGPEGIGKGRTARALAMALNCDRHDPNGCGTCDACRKIESGTHPDVLVFDMTPKGLTERVRELVGAVGYRPHEGRARLVLLDPADDLAGPQQKAEPANVLLKTLEEPPRDTHFVLVTAQPRRLPITVRSRCQRLRFQPLEDATIEAVLVEQHGVSPPQARVLAAQAGGSLARAVAELATEEEAQPAEARSLVETLVSAVRKGEPRAIFDAAGELGGDREQAEATVSLLGTLLRDALLVREQLHRGRVSPARADLAAQLLGDRPSSTLLRALQAAGETTRALRGNVAPALALEHLMLSMIARSS
jgi:DNA polymerase III subunit delta'